MLNENLDTFLADFGQAVTVGAASILGILDMPDEDVAGVAISTEYALVIKTSDAPTADHGTSVAIGSDSFVVRSAKKISDGSFTRLVLSKT